MIDKHYHDARIDTVARCHRAASRLFVYTKSKTRLNVIQADGLEINFPIPLGV